MKKTISVIFYSASVHYINSRGRRSIKRFNHHTMRGLRLKVENYLQTTDNRIIKVHYCESVWFDRSAISAFEREHRGVRVVVDVE